MLDSRLAQLNGEWLDVEHARMNLEYLRERAGNRRADHSISVARLLFVLAQDLDLNAAHAVAVGLLHDSCKGLKNEAMLDAASRFGIEISELQKSKLSLLHGPVAAEMCKRDLAIDEPDIYDAIYWHVTGRPGLGLLGQALFFADFSEPLRRHELSTQARAVYDERGFRDALRFAARSKLDYVAEKGGVIDPQARAFYAWLEAEPCL